MTTRGHFSIFRKLSGLPAAVLESLWLENAADMWFAVRSPRKMHLMVPTLLLPTISGHSARRGHAAHNV